MARPHTLLPDTLAGASAGACAKTMVAPLERVKVLMQLMASRGGAGSATVWGVFKNIYFTEGVKGLYRGNGTNVLRVAPVYAVKFGVNDYYLHLFSHGATPTSFQLLVV